jgi:hypothetical protein
MLQRLHLPRLRLPPVPSPSSLCGCTSTSRLSTDIEWIIPAGTMEEPGTGLVVFTPTVSGFAHRSLRWRGVDSDRQDIGGPPDLATPYEVSNRDSGTIVLSSDSEDFESMTPVLVNSAYTLSVVVADIRSAVFGKEDIRGSTRP